MAIRRTALMVCRIQPLHLGHTNLINMMIADYETVVVCVGSTDRSRERHDPWTFEERKQMLRNVYHNRIKIVQLDDLGAEQGSNEWADYVLGKVEKVGLPPPTDYYTGSVADGTWYVGRFVPEQQRTEPTPGQQVEGLVRHLHVVRRDRLPYASATEIRTFLETRYPDWRESVPRVNHELIESTYPEEFRVTD